MVAFTSIVKLLSLVAAAQVVKSAAIDQSLVSIEACNEDWSFSDANTIKFESLVYDYSTDPVHLTTKGGNMSIWRKQTDASQGKFVTTILTKNMENTHQYTVRVDWKQGQAKVSRYFHLEASKECRVKFSGDYDSLVGATYVEKKSGGP